jgi:hypothetical protein
MDLTANSRFCHDAALGVELSQHSPAWQSSELEALARESEGRGYHVDESLRPPTEEGLAGGRTCGRKRLEQWSHRRAHQSIEDVEEANVRKSRV